jgi:hypothetical protein
VKIRTASFRRAEQLRYLGRTKSKFALVKKEQMKVRECLLSFGAEYFVFHFAVEKYKD